MRFHVSAAGEPWGDSPINSTSLTLRARKRRHPAINRDGKMPSLRNVATRCRHHERKDKPIGDGSRLESGRAMSLGGSTPSPSAHVRQVATCRDSPKSNGTRLATCPTIRGSRCWWRCLALNQEALVRFQPPGTHVRQVANLSRNTIRNETGQRPFLHGQVVQLETRDAQNVVPHRGR